MRCWASASSGSRAVVPLFAPFFLEPDASGHNGRVWGDFAWGRLSGGALLIGRAGGSHGGGGGALTYGTYARKVARDLTEYHIRNSTVLPEHPVEKFMDVEPVPMRARAVKPSRCLQVYVDDFCLAATQSMDGQHIPTLSDLESTASTLFFPHQKSPSMRMASLPSLRKSSRRVKASGGWKRRRLVSFSMADVALFGSQKRWHGAMLRRPRSCSPASERQ